jgi:GT2 family glycosyltransferase
MIGDCDRQPEATCVIVAFHRPGLTEALVAALSHPALETIVVNVEADAAIGKLRGVQVISTTDNVGYAAAVNAGARAAQAAVTVFMNDDVAATAADVLRLAEHVRRGRADAAIPLVEDERGHLELGRRAPLGLAKMMLLQGMPITAELVRVDAAWAVMVAVHTELLRRIPLPEAYFLYWEEFEWFYNLKRDEKVVKIDPGVRVTHAGGPGVVTADKSRLLARNAVRCVRRTRGRSAALRAWPVVIGWQVRHLIGAVLRLHTQEIASCSAGVGAALCAWREV